MSDNSRKIYKAISYLGYIEETKVFLKNVVYIYMFKDLGDRDYSDTAKLAEKILPEDDFYVKYSKEIYPLIKDEDFKSFYGTTGHPINISPAALAHALIIQVIEDKTDRDMARAIATRIDLKYALHLPLSFKLHFDALSEFRLKFIKEGKESIIFDKVIEFLKNKGMIDPKEQRIDSTMILARGRVMKRYETVREGIKKASKAVVEKSNSSEEVHKKASELLAKYEKKRASFKETEKEMDKKLAESLIDAKDLLDSVKNIEELSESKEIKLLEEIYNQQGEVVYNDDDNDNNENKNESNKQVEVKIVPNSKLHDNIVNPYDPDMRCATKNSKKYFGVKCQITETTSKEKPKFITSVITTAANISDSELYKDSLEERKRNGILGEADYADKAYINGGNICVAEKNGVDLRGFVSKPAHDVYPIEYFKISEDKKVATCPAGKDSRKSWEYYDKRIKQKIRVYEFSEQDCSTCPLKVNCTKGKKRKLSIGEYYQYTQKVKERSASPEFTKDVFEKRNGIEGTFFQFIKMGGRRSRYFGITAIKLNNFLRACGINIKRFIRFITGQGPPITQHNLSYATV